MKPPEHIELSTFNFNASTCDKTDEPIIKNIPYTSFNEFKHFIKNFIHQIGNESGGFYFQYEEINTVRIQQYINSEVSTYGILEQENDVSKKYDDVDVYEHHSITEKYNCILDPDYDYYDYGDIKLILQFKNLITKIYDSIGSLLDWAIVFYDNSKYSEIVDEDEEYPTIYNINKQSKHFKKLSTITWITESQEYTFFMLLCSPFNTFEHVQQSLLTYNDNHDDEYYKFTRYLQILIIFIKTSK